MRHSVIPTDWTPQEATAVFEFLAHISEFLRDEIWIQYHQQIQLHAKVMHGYEIVHPDGNTSNDGDEDF